MGLAILPANALMPWLSVAPPVESTFLLLQQSWVLIAGWLVAIVLSVRSDRRRGLPGAVQPHTPRTRDLRSAAAAAGSAPLVGQSNGWLPNVIVLLLVALAVFCLLLGTPLIGSLSAESILRTLRCSAPLLMDSNPWGGFCGFWIDRLEPYQRPWYGALLAPVWLFTQFSAVLLAWMALIAVLVLAFAYRLGWGALLNKIPTFVKAGGLLLLGAALLGQFYGLAAPPMRSDGGLGGLAGVLPIVFTVGAVLVLGLLAGVIGLFAFAIHVARYFKQTPDQTAPPKKIR